ncbi:MAG: GH92 family glycosyl hydrolase [Flavobacteriales bacterium]|nr:GH92 family glycosyl hydrolase [Flavobacteriales bacterium]
MKKISFLFILIPISALAQWEWVNPFIGTGGTGHTFPGATVPFGMVQAGPDTRIDGSWEGCSGYHYSDSVIYGFSHTHLSGTGCSDYGDIMIMPYVGKIPDNTKGAFYASSFSHFNEKAEPGYYAVTLNRGKVRYEVTTTARAAFHKFSFSNLDTLHLVVDFSHRDERLSAGFTPVMQKGFHGYRQSKAWATDQMVYFSAETDLPFVVNRIIQDEKGVEMAILSFPVKGKNMVQLKLALSAVDEKGAEKNRVNEIPDFDFEGIRLAARKKWNAELSKIQVQGGSDKEKINLYTSLYHACIHPNVFSDVDGRYRGRDGKIYRTESNYYTVFSLWDTFRALHPLHTLINRKRTEDFVTTFLAQYKQGGRLPMWELWCNETDCMIGYHAVSVLADAYAKGIPMDINLALEAAVSNATYLDRGVPVYDQKGYLEVDDEHESVAKTLEYAYDDWCVAVLAKAAGNKEVYHRFLKRSISWIHLLDKSTGLMRPRVNGGWLNPFDPREVNNHYTEANSWQYSFFVPHDVKGLIHAIGGNDRFELLLDKLFTEPQNTTGRTQVDITGLIGQYAHGNEPSHHMAYLYNYLLKPEKATSKIYQILDSLYQPTPDGLPGNEDCGQMSAWYIFSAAGFYPVTPGSDIYHIGFPLFKEITWKFENGKQFTVKAEGNIKGNWYLKELFLNGKPLNRLWIKHEELMEGGTLYLKFADTPSLSFSNFKLPDDFYTNENVNKIPAPEIKAVQKVFKNKQRIELIAFDSSHTVYYTLDGTDPETKGRKYTNPIEIYEKSIVRAVSKNTQGYVGAQSMAQFWPFPNPDWKVNLASVYNTQYSAGGPEGLIDGLRGDENWRKGGWQGYQNTDFDVMIELGNPKTVNKISVGFLQDLRSWIVMPKSVLFELYDANKKVLYSQAQKFKVDDKTEKVFKEEISQKVNFNGVKYIRIIAENYGNLPMGHPGAGSPAFIFVDEVIVE